MDSNPTSEHLSALSTQGFVHLTGPHVRSDDAWKAARVVVDAAAETDHPLEVIGDYTVPPPGGSPSREFQTLHLDFGLPLVPLKSGDVARVTALHLAGDTSASDAATRLVPLRSLLRARSLPTGDELIRRFVEYGESHGAWDDTAGYVEGSLARIVEAALGQPPVLPSVKTHAGFLCGAEFANLADECEFFARRGLQLEAFETEVHLRPGEVLVFDNLAVAHGRRGIRRPGELHQRVFGHHALPVAEQVVVRDRVLAALVA